MHPHSLFKLSSPTRTLSRMLRSRCVSRLQSASLRFIKEFPVRNLTVSPRSAYTFPGGLARSLVCKQSSPTHSIIYKPWTNPGQGTDGFPSETNAINHLFGTENKFLTETMCQLEVPAGRSPARKSPLNQMWLTVLGSVL